MFNVNNYLLYALGVGHPALNKVFELSSGIGQFPCKLTGAGGGGCAITLLPSSNPPHINELRDALR